MTSASQAYSLERMSFFISLRVKFTGVSKYRGCGGGGGDCGDGRVCGW